MNSNQNIFLLNSFVENDQFFNVIYDEKKEISILNNKLLNKKNIIKEAIFSITKIKKINNWTIDEDKKLIEVVTLFENKNWKKISNFFEGKSVIQCSSRFRRIKPGITKGYWTEEEDKKLLFLFNKYGRNWKLLAREFDKRSGKQIRDRFLNSLNPELKKEKFTLIEDKNLIFLYNNYGPAWSKISKCFTGRSGDMVKNRLYSFIRRKIIPINKNMIFNKRILINKNLKNENNPKNENFGNINVCVSDNEQTIESKPNDSKFCKFKINEKNKNNLIKLFFEKIKKKKFNIEETNLSKIFNHCSNDLNNNLINTNTKQENVLSPEITDTFKNKKFKNEEFLDKSISNCIIKKKKN